MPVSPLPRLREIREAQRYARNLRAERDKLILKALKLGFSERQIAQASGLTAGRINQIRLAAKH